MLPYENEMLIQPFYVEVMGQIQLNVTEICPPNISALNENLVLELTF